MRIVTRGDQQFREHELLSPDAAFSDESDGRDRSSDPDFLRNDFQRDRDKILHTKSFRRLSHKTQVFLAAEGDHFRTRLTHTLEVSQIARTIARALGLNEDLAEASRSAMTWGTRLSVTRARTHCAVQSPAFAAWTPKVSRPPPCTATTSRAFAWSRRSRTVGEV